MVQGQHYLEECKNQIKEIKENASYRSRLLVSYSQVVSHFRGATLQFQPLHKELYLIILARLRNPHIRLTSWMQ